MHGGACTGSPTDPNAGLRRRFRPWPITGTKIRAVKAGARGLSANHASQLRLNSAIASSRVAA
jgi:hypothetical protein